MRNAGKMKWVPVALALAAAVLPACSDDKSTADPTTTKAAPDVTNVTDSTVPDTEAPLEPIEVTMVLSSASLAMSASFIGIDGGIFEENGLIIDIVDGGSTSDVMTLLVSGDANVGLSGATAPILATARGEDMVVLANAYAGFVTSLVVSNEIADALGDSPSIAEAMAAIDGKTIAAPSAGSSATAMLSSTAEANGSTPDITFISQSEMPAALSTGAIDGYVASPPFPDAAELEGFGKVLVNGPAGEWPGSSEEFVQVSVAVSKQWYEDNPDAAERLIASFDQIAEFVSSDPEAAGELVRGRFADLDPELFDAMWASNVGAFTRPVATLQGLEEVRATMVGPDIPAGVDDVDLSAMLVR